MAQLVLCDVCKEIIKAGSRKYVVAINTITQGQSITSLQDFNQTLRNYQKQAQKVQIFEICEGCKEVLEHLLTIRKNELTQLRKEFKLITNAGDKEE